MKTLIGKVTSAKMEKTVVVTVESHKAHPLYKKIMKQQKKIKADSGKHALVEGDVVKIGETKPKSKNKRFTVLEVLNKS